MWTIVDAVSGLVLFAKTDSECLEGQTAVNDGNYTVVANATFTDPSPIEGKGYRVFVRNGTAVIGGFSYGAKTLVFRVFHSGSWSNVYYLDYVTIDSNFQTKINLSTNVNTDQASNSKYPSVKAVFDWATNLFFPKPTGTTAQYLRGDGTVATFPTIPDPSDFVEKSDFTSHSILAKQSGAGDPVAVSIGNNEFLGRKSGGGSNIEGLSVSEVKSLLNYTASDVGAVATTRNITINGTTQDLSADRTFSAVMLTGMPTVVNVGVLGAVRYFAFSALATSVSEISRRIIMCNAITVKNFYIYTSTAQPATGSHVLTILKNGVATGIVVTIPSGSAAGVFSDTTNSESFAQGDAITIQAVNNAATNSGTIVSLQIGSL